MAVVCCVCVHIFALYRGLDAGEMGFIAVYNHVAGIIVCSLFTVQIPVKRSRSELLYALVF